MGASTSASELTLDFRQQIARDLRGHLLRAASTAGESGFTETDEEEPQDEVNATPRRPDAKEAETKDEADPGGTLAASLRASLTTSAPPVDSAASPASTPLERPVRRGGGRSKPRAESAALLKAYLDARAAEQAAARQTAPQQATSRSRKGRQTSSQQARTVSVQSDVVIPTVALMSPSARQSRVVQLAPSPPATPPSSASSASSSSSSSSSSAESASASSDSSTDSASSGHRGSSRKRRRRHRGRRGSARHKDGKSEARLHSEDRNYFRAHGSDLPYSITQTVTGLLSGQKAEQFWTNATTSHQADARTVREGRLLAMLLDARAMPRRIMIEVVCRRLFALYQVPAGSQERLAVRGHAAPARRLSNGHRRQPAERAHPFHPPQSLVFCLHAVNEQLGSIVSVPAKRRWTGWQQVSTHWGPRQQQQQWRRLASRSSLSFPGQQSESSTIVSTEAVRRPPQHPDRPVVPLGRAPPAHEPAARGDRQ